ncbi:hypothetical protein DFH06DRAFT_1151214 [Mycena polygramma]|nr:hypothetical protein DFH06DRAFT_1151214 [Mycena polygramma]
MSQQYHPAPAAAAAPAAAGAGAPANTQQVDAALTAMIAAVQALTANANTLIGAPMADVHNAVNNVTIAASAVEQAHAVLCASITALVQDVNAAPAPAPAIAPAPAPAIAPAPAPTVAAPAAPAPAPAFARMAAPWVAGYLYGVVPEDSLARVPDNGEKWFAITRGKYVGLTKNSAISLAAVTGVARALSHKFNNQTDALDHFNGALATQAVAVLN